MFVIPLQTTGLSTLLILELVATKLNRNWSQHWFFVPKGWGLWNSMVSYRSISSHWFCCPIQFVFFSFFFQQDQYVFSSHRRPPWPLISTNAHMGKSISRKPQQQWSCEITLLQFCHNKMSSVSFCKVSERPVAVHEKDHKQRQASTNVLFLFFRHVLFCLSLPALSVVYLLYSYSSTVLSSLYGTSSSLHFGDDPKVANVTNNDWWLFCLFFL